MYVYTTYLPLHGHAEDLYLDIKTPEQATP